MAQRMDTILRRNASRREAREAVKKVKQLHTLVPRQIVSRQSKEKMVAPFSGLVAGAVEISTTFPFEWMKVQAQLNRNNPNYSVVKHLRSEGLGIYKGLTPMLIGAPIQGLLRFSCLDYFTAKFTDSSTGKISLASGLGAGILSGVLESVVVVSPMERIKTVCINSNSSLLASVQYVLKNDGVSGMYRGLGPTIAKSAGNQATRFVVFNQYKNIVLENSNDKLKGKEAMLGGILSGLASCITTTPLDSIKSRMQGVESARYKNLLHCGQTMVKEEGLLSLYKGFAARCGRVVPGQGIIFCVYNSLSNNLKSNL